MSRNAARGTFASEAASAVRSAFTPRYGRALADEEVGEIIDNLSRFYGVLSAWEAEAQAGLGPVPSGAGRPPLTDPAPRARGGPPPQTLPQPRRAHLVQKAS